MNYFPHLLVLIAGCIVLYFMKKKYRKMRNQDLIIIFILLVILVAIFTDFGISLIKKFINFIQVE